MSTLHVETIGQGPALVMLHGWGLNLRVFDRLRRRLAGDYTVIGIDLPGHGRSTWEPALQHCDAQLELLRQALPPRASILGWSLGGQLALQLAARVDTEVQRLILLATTPRFVCSDDWPQAMASATLERFAQQLTQDYRRTVADFLELQVRGSAAADEVLQHLRASLLEHGEAQAPALGAGLEMLRQNDLRALASRCTLPTLIMAGQHDRITPPAAARALARLMPHAAYLELRRAGHALFLSHVEDVAREVRNFLSADAARAAAP